MASGTRLPGQGRPKKGVLEKAEAGNPGHRPLEVLDIPEALGAADLEGVDMPPVKEYMKSAQRNGEKFLAEDIYKEVWTWLKKLGCETLVSSQMIEHYAMAQARYIQCQEAISQFGCSPLFGEWLHRRILRYTLKKKDLLPSFQFLILYHQAKNLLIHFSYTFVAF